VRIRRLEVEQWFPRPIDEVFAFFADAHNLDAITPPWLHFRIMTPAPIAMAAGTLIDYRLRLHRVPIRWRTRITAWEPPTRFVDCQIRGPYRQWLHEHMFESREGGTWMRDRIDYSLWGFGLEALLHRYFVGPDVQAIFAYRREKLAARLGR